jgi:hypothetical protein
MVSLWCRIKPEAVHFTKVGAGSLWIVCTMECVLYCGILPMD